MNNNIYPETPGVEQKSIALCIILSLITCGIYGLYWMYTLTEDVNAISGDTNASDIFILRF